ncbi:hypothetical protein [Arthrobacter sp. R-11]|uniref:hypothetical protein n=1 Tax=Arthrobacter sp. R-11 TaxID=3404053 RepID=UPI003CF06436
MGKEHYDAIEAMLPAGLNVHRGSAPLTPEAEDYPYVVIGGTPGTETTEALSGPPDSLDLPVKITYAGLTFDSVLITIRDVRAALNRKRPQITGWVCDPLKQSSLVDIRTDYDVMVPGIALNPVYAVDEFGLFATH